MANTTGNTDELTLHDATFIAAMFHDNYAKRCILKGQSFKSFANYLCTIDLRQLQKICNNDAGKWREKLNEWTDSLPALEPLRIAYAISGII